MNKNRLSERLLITAVAAVSFGLASQPLFTPPAYAEQAVPPCTFQIMRSLQEPGDPAPRGRGDRPLNPQA